MEGPPLGPGGEDITWPDQVAPRGRKASSTRKIKPQTSNLTAARRQTATYRGAYSWWYGRRLVTLIDYQETEEEKYLEVCFHASYASTGGPR